MNTHKSEEDYLEAILMLSENGKSIRSIDIANELGFSRPSVSVAMKNLRNNCYILMDDDGFISLTESGQEIAQKMYDRHVLISDWLIFLGVDRETAVNDACKIEHDLSEQTFLALKKHIQDWKRDVYSKK